MIDRIRRRWQVTPATYEKIAWAALVLLTLIVSTGAAVRLTGSGLGCPEWPRCNEASLTPEHGHAFIEFGNRLITFPVALASGLAWIGALARVPYRRDFAVIGAVLVAGVLAQAVLGGITVITGLHPVTVMAHFLLSMVTLAFAATLVFRARRERRDETATPEHDRRTVTAVRALAAFGAVVIVLGTTVTASGPFTGGEGTNDRVGRITWLGEDTFGTLIATHSRLAAVFGVAAVALWWFARRQRAAATLVAALTVTCVLVAIEGAVGTLQYHLLDLSSREVVWIHVTLAALLWSALSWCVLAAGRAAEAPAAARDDGMLASPVR